MNSAGLIINRQPSKYPVVFFSRVCLVAVLALAGTACGFTRPEQLQLISPAELNRTLQAADILLIDVHTPEQKHIPGTDHYVPFYKVDDFLDRFPADKAAPIYLYCKSGPMGNWAARTLLQLGYTNLYNLEGGIEAWLAQNLPKPAP